MTCIEMKSSQNNFDYLTSKYFRSEKKIGSYPSVNFIKIICAHFSYKSLFKAKTYLEKAVETTFVRKNVDEIDTWIFFCCFPLNQQRFFTILFWMLFRRFAFIFRVDVIVEKNVIKYSSSLRLRSFLYIR